MRSVDADPETQQIVRAAVQGRGFFATARTWTRQSTA